MHRHHCPTTAAERGACELDAECDRFVAGLRPSARHLLTTRGLLAAADMAGHQPNEEASFEWSMRPDDGVIPADATIYTDGSMVDGPTKALGRVGFGFAAYDNEGTLIAKAFGTPPRWIDSVPGAEA